MLARAWCLLVWAGWPLALESHRAGRQPQIHAWRSARKGVACAMR
jgi:hypothetical protein